MNMLDSVQKEKAITSNGYEEKTWKIVSSHAAKNCRNYIREIVDNLVLEPNPEKDVIALSIGKLHLL